MTVAIRTPITDELGAFADCIDVSFGERFTPTERDQLLASFEQACLLGAFDDDQLIGTLAYQKVELTVPGPRCVEVSGLSDIAVMPSHRRRGVFGELVSTALGRLHDDGESIAVLEASDGGAYGRFGFGAATYSARYRAERARALPLQATDSPGCTVRSVSANDARSLLPRIFAEQSRHRPGEIGRSSPWWDEFFAPDDRSPRALRHFVVSETNGHLDGYLVYEIHTGIPEFRDRSTHIVEIVAVNDAAYRVLYRFAFDVDELSFALTAADRPIDDPIRFMLYDPRALEVVGLQDHLWLRLIDVASALGARRYRAAGHLVVEVRDPRCPWNERNLAIEVADDGSAEVRDSRHSAEIVCDAAHLAAAYLGGASLVAMSVAGAIDEIEPGALDRADLLFGSPRPPYCSSLA